MRDHRPALRAANFFTYHASRITSHAPLPTCFPHPVAQNAFVSPRERAIVWLLLAALAAAGCYSNRKGQLPPDWEASPEAPEGPSAVVPSIGAPTVVATDPLLAPPPTNSPAGPDSAYPVSPLTNHPLSLGYGAAGASRITHHESRNTYLSLAGWCKANQLPAPTLLAAAPVPAYALKTAHGTLLLRPGNQVAFWDGLELRLGFAPQMLEGEPYVHSLDLEKTIEPLVRLTPDCLKENLNANPVVVIDPGHGGENVGTKSVLGARYEKEFTLDWALRLERLLATNGWQVFLTRSDDANPALSNRVAFAQEHKAALFLSLHFNSAGPDESQAGLETYCLTPCGMTSTVTRGYSDDPGLSFPNNAFDSQNLQLACLVHRALLQVNGNRDRGVRRARFPGVLRGQQRPAILIEGGYLSNPLEARQIADPAYRQKLAEAVARALAVKSVVSSQ